MIEFAPSGAYVEDWRFEAPTGSRRVALRLVGQHAGDGRITPRAGGLVIVGDLAILSLGRTRPLPPQALPTLIREAEDLSAATAAAFDAVTLLAQEEEVILATNPFLEGAPLPLGDFEPGGQAGLVEERREDCVRLWRIHALAA
jgi:hypothetical protein